jgi:signal transduction histidine kinase
VQEVIGHHSNPGRWVSSSKKALVVLAVLLTLLLVGASLRGRPSSALTAFGDLTQFFLLASSTLFFAWRSVSTHSTARAFWLLIALGFGMWSANMFSWVYYEVWLNHPVPSLPIGQFLLFIKLVPMLAAVALEPKSDHPDRTRLLGVFDLTSLLVCWTYLYLFWAMVYMVAGNDLARYNRNSDILDVVGNAVLVFVLAVVALRSRGRWRGFYLHFLGATATYSLASVLINHAINSKRYYTGSIYDVPLTAAMAWFCIISVSYDIDSQPGQSQSWAQSQNANRPNGRSLLRSARLSMLATLSTPTIGLWLVISGETQDPVQHFRILLSLFTMLLLTILLLLKQDLLNFKLGGHLRDTSLAYSNLRRFQEQLVQSEKLASLGKLVAQVAHQIDESMTAVNKDVDVLSSNPAADAGRRRMTGKIRESTRRTSTLVENMLSFAQEMPLHRTSVNVLPLLDSAVNLTRAGRRFPVRVEIQKQSSVPLVEGDVNQLIQVFLHIIVNAIDAMEENEERLLTIAIRAIQDHLEIEFADTGVGVKDPSRVFEPFYTTKPVGRGVGLGLSTCYGIIRQHGGEIECHNRPEGGAVFRLMLPAAQVTPVVVEVVGS